jgi:alcohol dehydrogenase
MTLSANWSYPTAIRIGSGRLAELADACRDAGIQRPLLVTDRGLAALEITTRARAALEVFGDGAGIFGGVAPNPDERQLEAGLEVYRSGDHDGVVAFGGGSALDLGKLIAFMSGQHRPVWDFEDIGDWWTRADPAGIAPSVAVPTTAGTGSEVGRAGVLVNTATEIKKIIFHPRMLPKQVICDPDLTVGMPPAITAGTGLDAFAHCLEAYCSPHFHPMSQGIALEGMRLVREYLPRAHANGTDIEARTQMMAAATMGAVALQKGLGAIHALSHPIGAVYNTHHGTTNAVVMPAVLHFNRPAIEARIERAATYLGLTGGFAGFVDEVLRLRALLGIPDTLADQGVPDDRLDDLVVMALGDPSVGGNPIPMTMDNTRALLEACFRPATSA